jgi:hypothetical protein
VILRYALLTLLLYLETRHRVLDKPALFWFKILIINIAVSISVMPFVENLGCALGYPLLTFFVYDNAEQRVQGKPARYWFLL